jgi:hypothetical protein
MAPCPVFSGVYRAGSPVIRKTWAVAKKTHKAQGNCFFGYTVHSTASFKNNDACGRPRLRRAYVVFAQTRSRTGLMYLIFSSSLFLFSSFSPSLLVLLVNDSEYSKLARQ